MQDKNFTLDELAQLNDGTKVDLGIIQNKEDETYNLIKEEIEDFITKPVQKSVKKNKFFSSLPNTELKKSIENVIKQKNIKEEIFKKNVQDEFDRKMARIRKIKSKTYRKMKRRDKIRKEEALENCSTEESDCTESESENFRPIISFNNKKDEELESSTVESVDSVVNKAFEVPGFEGNEREFLSEKTKMVQEDAPKVIEHYLPGWGDWAGGDIKFQKNNFNTIVEKKDGIKIKNRQDYNKNNVIINEHIATNDKYKSILPYGYSKDNYKDKLKTPISIEVTSSKIFNRFVKSGTNKDKKQGEFIEPCEFNPEY